MKNITLDNVAAVNLEALDASVRAALGNDAVGISYNGGTLTLHLSDKAQAAQISQAQALVQAHNPAQLTPRQQAEADRQVKLEQYRRDYANEVDPTQFSGQPALIQKLAQKLALLEQEVVALREGRR